MNDQHEKKLLALYRRSRQEEPSQLTDERIRQAAHKVASIRSKEEKMPKEDRRWLWGLSTAAVLVLSFSIVLQVWMDQDEPFAVPQESALAPVSRAAPDLKPAPAPAASKLDADDTGFDSLSGMPTSAAPMSEQAVGKEESMFEEDLEEKAAHQKALQKKPLAHRIEQPVPDSPSLDAVIIPQLPDTLEGLQTMLPRQLVVEQSESGLIVVYMANKLILTVQPQAAGSVYKAWPGSEALGVKVNWQLNPQQLMACKDGSVYLTCPLQRNVDAHFEGTRLDFILWRQE